MSNVAHTIITNARVFTADSANPTAHAVAIKGNKILFVGNNIEASAFRGSATRVIDAGGRTVMPGFIDSHFHLMYGSLNLDGMQLEPVSNFQDLTRVVLEYASENPDLPWLAGTGLRYNAGPEFTTLTRHHLDSLVADRPIYINAFDGHTSWANTAALKMAGLFNGGDAGANSEIVMEANGTASGELREPGAFQPVSDMVPKPDEARKRALLHKGLKLTASLGVTSVHNMDGTDSQAALYAALEDLGELTCRVYMPYSVSPETELEQLEREATHMKNTYTDGLVRAGSAKFFYDGVIESYTGLLVDPYADDPSTCGSSNYEVVHFSRLVTVADRLGMQCITHSVGDMGVRRILDAYQAAALANGRRDSRHRVEHIELVHPHDLFRFKELGVIASMQPLHSPMQVDSNDIWPQRVGPQRWPHSFAWKTLRDAGATLVFGSDWPVAPQHAMRGVSNAVNRKPWVEGMPEQNQTLLDTLYSYTRDAAYAEFQEKVKGQIKPGYLADIVLLSEDIFNLPSEKLAAVRPLLTMVDGRIVYEG